MANGEQLRNLKKKGVAWRKEHPTGTVDLRGADFSGADLRGKHLSMADLSGADLSGANLNKADLRSARLQSAKLDAAQATDISLWEAQRAGWSIKGILCERAYWDQKKEEVSTYSPGEFERLFAEQPVIELFYKDGLSKFELNTLPALLQHLTTLHPGREIRLKSMQETAGGAKVAISIDDADSRAVEEIKADAQKAHAAQMAIRDDRVAQLEIERRLLLDEVFPRMLAAAGHHVHFAGPANRTRPVRQSNPCGW